MLIYDHLFYKLYKTKFHKNFLLKKDDFYGKNYLKIYIYIYISCRSVNLNLNFTEVVIWDGVYIIDKDGNNDGKDSDNWKLTHLRPTVPFLINLLPSDLQFYEKRDSNTYFFLWFCVIFKNIFFIEHLDYICKIHSVNDWFLYNTKSGLE